MNGNQIHAVNNGNSVGAYAYSLFGNQSSFTTSDHVHTYYTYRPDGLRHSIDDKVHVWDGANIVADIDGNNVSIYIRGINLIYADDGDRTSITDVRYFIDKIFIKIKNSFSPKNVDFKGIFWYNKNRQMKALYDQSVYGGIKWLFQNRNNES